MQRQNATVQSPREITEEKNLNSSRNTEKKSAFGVLFFLLGKNLHYCHSVFFLIIINITCNIPKQHSSFPQRLGALEGQRSKVRGQGPRGQMSRPGQESKWNDEWNKPKQQQQKASQSVGDLYLENKVMSEGQRLLREVRWVTHSDKKHNNNK